MKTLVLGGTGFLGRALVLTCLEDQQWSVTTFNRGVTGPDLAGASCLRGDRYDQAAVAAAAGSGPWDVVIDCSGYVPRNVLEVAEAFRGHAARYVFISTVSAYAGWPTEPLTESSPLLEAPSDAGPDFGVNVEDGPTQYGYQKAGCEAAVIETFGADQSLILRPGVVLGPREYVGRLVWWLNRVSAGGRVIGPGHPDRAIQPVDVRDVAEFTADAVAEGTVGAYNVTAPVGSATFGELLTECNRVTGGGAQIEWIEDDALLSLGVRQWSEMPLWRVSRGVWSVSSERAAAAGLRTRPLAQTISDTWLWMREGGQVDGRDRAAEIGMSPEREAQLWRALDARVGEPR